MSFTYPKILNLIWDSSKLAFLNYITIMSFKKYHVDWDIHIYYTTKSESHHKKWSTPEQQVELEDRVVDYWPTVSKIPGVKMICVDEFVKSLELEKLHPVQQSDIIRIYVLYTYGGVYSDFDVIFVKNMEKYFIPYSNYNLLFFGVEPNGFVYFPVGFFISKPHQECYKQLLQFQLAESKNQECTADYQYFGASLLRRLKVSGNPIISAFRLLSAKCYIPVVWSEIEKKIYKPREDKLVTIDNDSFAIHWFNGAGISKKYINFFRKDNFPPGLQCTMDHLISEYIPDLDLQWSESTELAPPSQTQRIGCEVKENVEENVNSKVSVVMAYINRKRQLQHTLDTISKSQYKNLEIIIVDDGSLQDQRVEDLVCQYDMEIIVIRIEPSEKRWINPCIPYNIGLSKSTGDIIILQNPEVCHVGDIIQYCKDNITDNKYLTFSVINSPSAEENEKIYKYDGIIPHWDVQQVFTPHSWYNHPTCRNSQFHFLSCMTRNTLNIVGGFNEQFKNGLSYDDDEFITRLRRVVDCFTLPPDIGFGIHLWHPGGSVFYDKKVDLLQTLININSQLHKELCKSPVVYCHRGEDCTKYKTTTNKNVIVFGATGMLGRYVSKYLRKQGFNVREVTREHLDLDKNFDLYTIEGVLLPLTKPNTIIVNCIGRIPQYSPLQDSRSFTIVNTLFPRYLSILAEKIKCRLISITTDCVYSGATRPVLPLISENGVYSENDQSDAIDTYGITKSLGETNRDIIIRTSIVGEELKGRNSLLEWVKSNANGDITGYTGHYWNGVTCLELSKIIYKIIREGLYWSGVRHIHSPNKVSKYQLVSYINDIWNLNIRITKSDTTQIVDKSLRSIYDHKLNPRKNIYHQLQELKNFNLAD